MQTSKEEPKTKKSRARASKAATSNPNPDVQESPQAVSILRLQNNNPLLPFSCWI